MKKVNFIMIVICILCFGKIVAAQDSGKGLRMIGITFSSLGENAVVSQNEADIFSQYSFESKKFFTIGLTYIHPLNSWLEMETGIEYSRHTVIATPNWGWFDSYGYYTSTFPLVNVPLTLRASFLKYFFVNTGVMIDLDPFYGSLVDNQTGMGAIIGVGASMDFSGFSVFINPYHKNHALIPFFAHDSSNRQRVWETGIRAGLNYQLKPR